MDRTSEIDSYVHKDIEPWLIADVAALDFPHLKVTFADGKRFEIEIPQQDRYGKFPSTSEWQSVFVWQYGGAIAWPNHYDIGADYLRELAEKNAVLLLA